MKLDREFEKELIQQSNGDGTIESHRSFLKVLRAVKKDLSSIDAPKRYDACIRTYGRVAVAICTAVTITAWEERHDTRTVLWAREVLKCWTNRAKDILEFFIDDGLHPTRIDDYALSFIRMTSVTDN